MSTVAGALACPTVTPVAVALAGIAPEPDWCWVRYTPKPTAPANSSTTTMPTIIVSDGPRRAVTTDRLLRPVFLDIIARSPLAVRRELHPLRRARPATSPTTPRAPAGRRRGSAPSRRWAARRRPAH